MTGHPDNVDRAPGQRHRTAGERAASASAAGAVARAWARARPPEDPPRTTGDPDPYVSPRVARMIRVQLDRLSRPE